MTHDVSSIHGRTAVLVVGYGRELRGDDRAGRIVADRVGALGLPGVRVRSVTQLVPELAEEIARAERVVFVDAAIGADSTTVRPVVPETNVSGALTHHCTPASLVGLAALVGRAPATVELVSIPARNLEIGEELSDATTDGMERAVELIRARA